MEKVKTILTEALGEKAASDFIKACMEVDDVQLIKKRTCTLLDTRKPENRCVYEILMREKVRRCGFGIEGYRKTNTNPNALCDDDDLKPFKNNLDKENLNICESISPTQFKSIKKSKRKFQPLFCEGAQSDVLVSLLPGRHPCQCLATKHQLVNNCTQCGRIVCQQEGSGPCYFCGNLVATQIEHDQIAMGTKQSIKLRNKLAQLGWAPGILTPYEIKRRLKKSVVKAVAKSDTQSNEVGEMFYNNELKSEDDNEDYNNDNNKDMAYSFSNVNDQIEQGLLAALLNRDRLVDFDINCARRTRVIDDELDYFATEGGVASAAWLSPEVRARVTRRVAELKAQKNTTRVQSALMSLDLGTGEMTKMDGRADAAKELYSPDDATIDELKVYSDRSPDNVDDKTLISSESQITLPKFSKKILKDKNRTNSQIAHTLVSQVLNNSSNDNRIQDTEIKQIADGGFCLSMHQPWASFLVQGIKRAEGRSWYSTHRGFLWIASTQKSPGPDEIKQIESHYIQLGVPKSHLPSSYPTGCLLGRVNVIDILTQEEYRKEYPNEPSESPFLLICQEPQVLLIKFPIRGKHKIYKLDRQMHNTALKNLT